MSDFDMDPHIVIGDETVSLLNLIAGNELNLSAELLKHIIVSKNNFAAFLEQSNLEADPEALAILELLDDTGADRNASQESFETLISRPTDKKGGVADEVAVVSREPLEKRGLGDAEWLDRNAGYHLETGRFRDAERLYLDSLSIRVDLFGPEHPETAVGYNNLGELYHVSGSFDSAEQQYIHASSIREKSLGAEHPETADSLNNLAELYAKTGRFEQAESLYRSALAIREKVFGPQDPETAKILNNLGALHHNKGDYAMAESLYRKAIEVFREKLGHEHPSTIIVQDNLLELQEDRASVTPPSRKRSEDVPPPRSRPK